MTLILLAVGFLLALGVGGAVDPVMLLFPVAMGFALAFLMLGFKTLMYLVENLRRRNAIEGNAAQKLSIAVEVFLYSQVVLIPPVYLLEQTQLFTGALMLVLTPIAGFMVWLVNKKWGSAALRAYRFSSVGSATSSS